MDVKKFVDGEIGGIWGYINYRGRLVSCCGASAITKPSNSKRK